MNQTELYQTCFLKIIQNSKEWEKFLDYFAFYRGNDLTVLIPTYVYIEFDRVLEDKKRNNRFYMKHQNLIQINDIVYNRKEFIQKILPKEQMTSYEFELVLQSVLYLLEEYEGKEINKKNRFGNVIYLNIESTLKVLAFIQDTLNKITIRKDWKDEIWIEKEKIGVYGEMGIAWLKEKNYYRYLRLMMEEKLLDVYQEVDRLANQELDSQIKKRLGRVYKCEGEIGSKEYQKLKFQVIKWKAEQIVLEKIVFVER